MESIFKGDQRLREFSSIPSLRDYVLSKDEKDVHALEKAGLEWSKVRCENRLDYEVEWLGVPIIQTSEDLILMQELIFKVQPDVIIETGIAHGGGLIFYASLMELLGKGKVIGIDIDIRAHNREVIEMHPMFRRIELIQGDSTDDKIVQKLRERVPRDSKAIVFLDSDHTAEHVLKGYASTDSLWFPAATLLFWIRIRRTWRNWVFAMRSISTAPGKPYTSSLRKTVILSLTGHITSSLFPQALMDI